jgi:SAM-dependent methyltransferase
VKENIEKFVDELTKSLSAETFVKLTLGNYKGTEPHLQKVTARLVHVQKNARLSFQFRYDTRDTVKNYEIDRAVSVITELLNSGFRSGHLFTTAEDLQLTIGKKSSRLAKGKSTFKTQPAISHDRQKKRLIDPNAFYLKALGITTDTGEVRARHQDKWRQINKYVEILGGLSDRSSLRTKEELRIVDMGSGKGYLTFAAYDYFSNVRDLKVRMTGVDERPELITLCNQLAESGAFDGLEFVNGSISDFDVDGVDILIALHACDTATDDALFKGISAGAEIIVAAPCCHKEIRRQITPPGILKNILKHGTMLEREAETITDGLRSMLLERSGYSTKIFEFVATEHTPKNNMIVATRNHRQRPETRYLQEQIDAIKSFYGVSHQRLENLLA